MGYVVAVELCGLVPVRGAAGGVEQRNVVRVDELLGGRSGELTQANGEDRGAQCVLERLPGAEIGRERQCAHELSRTDLPFARRQR